MATTGLPTPEVAARYPDVPWAAACGFTLLVDTLALPQRFAFRVRAALPDGSRVKVAAIGGGGPPPGAGDAPRLQPVVVTPLRGGGAALLVRLLSAPPRGGGYARPPPAGRGGEDGHDTADAAAFGAPRGGGLRTSPLRGAGGQVLAARAQDAGRSHRCPQAPRGADGVPPRTAGRRR